MMYIGPAISYKTKTTLQPLPENLEILEPFKEHHKSAGFAWWDDEFFWLATAVRGKKDQEEIFVFNTKDRLEVETLDELMDSLQHDNVLQEYKAKRQEQIDKLIKFGLRNVSVRFVFFDTNNIEMNRRL